MFNVVCILNGKLTSNILNHKLQILTVADALNLMINPHIIKVVQLFELIY